MSTAGMLVGAILGFAFCIFIFKKATAFLDEE